VNAKLVHITPRISASWQVYPHYSILSHTILYTIFHTILWKMGLTMSTGHCKNATSGSDDERWPAKPVSWKSFSSSLLPGRINTRRLGVFSPRTGIDDGNFEWILGNF
jgi:hypothetical protein